MGRVKFVARHANCQGYYRRGMLLPKLISEENRIHETGATMGDMI